MSSVFYKKETDSWNVHPMILESVEQMINIVGLDDVHYTIRSGATFSTWVQFNIFFSNTCPSLQTVVAAAEYFAAVKFSVQRVFINLADIEFQKLSCKPNTLKQ